MIAVIRRALLHGMHRQDLGFDLLGPADGAAAGIRARIEGMRRAQADLEARIEALRAEVRVDTPADETE